MGRVVTLLLLLLVAVWSVEGLTRAEKRVRYWKNFLRETPKWTGKTDLLQTVNVFWNRNIRYLSDNLLNELALPTDKDYWQTPKESLKRGYGDCEDFAIGKYFSLRALGVPMKHLRLIYVKHRRRVAHMVLGFWANPENEFEDVLILDNIDGRLKPLSQRKDLLAIFSFNPKGMWLLKHQQGNRYRHKFARNAKGYKKWQDVFQKVAEGK